MRVRTDYGWWLVRASNTEAAIVARAEGKTPEKIKKLVKDIEAAVVAAKIEWVKL